MFFISKAAPTWIQCVYMIIHPQWNFLKKEKNRKKEREKNKD